MRLSRRIQRVAIAAVASLAAAVAIGCGLWLAGSADSSRDLRPADSAAPRFGQEVRVLAEQVYGSFAGTKRQQDAGLVMRTYVFNHVMDECLESAGYPEWDWSKSRQYATPKDPLAAGVWFAEPNRPFRSEALMAQRRNLLAEREMNADDTPAPRQAVIVECANSTPDAPSDEAEAATQPGVVATLRAEWYAAIAKVAMAVQDPAGYYTCMDAARIPILVDSGQPATELGEMMSALGPDDADLPSSASDPVAQRPGWQTFLAKEKFITDADWACRRTVYESHVMDLGPVIVNFASDHEQEILDAQRQWEEIEAQAAELGYTGQAGPLRG